MEEGPRKLLVSPSSITLVDGEKSESVAIADLERISIRTTDRGPFEDDMFWVFATHDGTLEVPSGIPGENDLWPVFDRLHGFDAKKVIEASGSTQNDTFLCWARKETTPRP